MTEIVKDKILNSFSDLQFESEGHVYTLDNQNLIPVSNIVSTFKNHFDTEKKSKEYADKYGKNVNQVREQWAKSNKDACDLGHRVHEFAERYFYNPNISPSDGFEQAVLAFWKSIPESIIPVMSESRLYSRKYRYAGTSDNLFYDKWQKGLIISDYKTNKDIFKNFRGQTMLYPFDHLLDSPFNNYQLQLSLYQIPLEDIGYKVVDRWIVWLKPDGTFEKYETMDFTKDLRQLLNSQNN